MTLRSLYRRAAFLARAYATANARTVALDVVTSRRVRCRTLGEMEVAWCAANVRAFSITAQRGFDAAVARNEARDRMLLDPHEEGVKSEIARRFAEISAARRKGMS